MGQLNKKRTTLEDWFWKRFVNSFLDLQANCLPGGSLSLGFVPLEHIPAVSFFVGGRNSTTATGNGIIYRGHFLAHVTCRWPHRNSLVGQLISKPFGWAWINVVLDRFFLLFSLQRKKERRTLLTIHHKTRIIPSEPVSLSLTWDPRDNDQAIYRNFGQRIKKFRNPH